MTLRRIVLVGFMGAGKTAVGRELARRLGWAFVDLDEEIEAEHGLSPGEIFDRLGEAAFREFELDASRRALGEDEVVIASGGGWAARPDALSNLPAGTETVWLKVSVQTALDRVSEQDVRRPLLEVGDPRSRAESLLSSRGAAYGRAELAVDTEGRTVEDVSARILAELAERYSQLEVL